MIKYDSIGLRLEKFEEGRYTVLTSQGIRLGQLLGGGRTWSAEPRRGATKYFKTLEAGAKWCLIECINDAVTLPKTRILDVAFRYKSRTSELALCDWETGIPKPAEWTGYAKFNDRYWFIDWDSFGDRQWSVIMQDELSPALVENLKPFYANDPGFDLRSSDTVFPGLMLTAAGRIFDGVLKNGWAGACYTGRIFGSFDHPEGTEIQTSTIVAIGFIPPFGFYIETRSRSRYLIAFDPDDKSWLEWITATRKSIKSNPEYFEPLIWSKTATADA